MKDLDPRLTFVEYVYHPLIRGFFHWARGQLVECLEGSGREWSSLVGELELLLSGSHSGPDPVEIICPQGNAGLDRAYPSRLIDHIVVESDLQINLLLDREGIEGRQKKLEWIASYLDDVLQAQERILVRAAANRLQPPVPDYEIINNDPTGVRYSALHNTRSFCFPELNYEMSEFESEMVKEFARVTPPFEEFSDNPPCFLGVYRWLIEQAEKAALTNDEGWERLLREFGNLERGLYFDQLPELIIAREDPLGFDYDQLRYFYVHELLNINDNIRLVLTKEGTWRSLSPLLKSHIDTDVSSPPAIAAWYLKADLQYLEALSSQTPPPTS